MVNATQKRPGVFLENAIFYLSLILLAATIGSFFYVRHLAEQSVAELADLSAQVAKDKTAEQKQLENRVIAAQRKLGDFSKIALGRKSAVNFFSKLEELTTGSVYFSKCELDFTKMTSNLSGHGQSFQDVGRQIIKFGSAGDAFNGIYLGKTAIGGAGGVDFETDIVLNPELVIFK